VKVDLYKTNGSSPPCIPTVDVVAQTAATLPNPRETVAVALEDPAIKGAIQRGARKAQVKKYSAVTKNGRDGVPVALEHQNKTLTEYAGTFVCVLIREPRCPRRTASTARP
jgi:hypothetical protein